MKGHEILPILIPSDLQDERAIEHIRIMAGSLTPYAGRQYYTVVPDISAPVLILDKRRLRELADAGWPAEGMESMALMILTYHLSAPASKRLPPKPA